MEQKVYQLSEICEIKSGKRIPKDMRFVEVPTNHPYIRARDIKDGKIGVDSLIYLEDKVYEKIKKYIICSDDIAITIVGASVGDIAYAQTSVNGYNLTENAVRLTDFNNKVHSKYLFYMLFQKQYKDFMQLIAGAAAQPKLGIYKIQKIKVKLPDFPEQKRIASVLSAYDDLIEKNNRKIQILQDMAEELYKEWFVRFRFPGHETAKFTDGIPDGWEADRIESLGVFARGKNITASEMIDGDIPVISAGIEPSGFHNEANVEGVSITISSSGANAGYMRINYSDIWAADCMYVNNVDNVFYLYELLNNIRPCIDNLQRGAAQPHVYAKDVNRLKIVLPAEEIRTKFNNIVKDMHLSIATLMKQNDILKQQRDLLLPRLMSGKHAVKVS